jgi:hypothetical protein
MFSARRLPICSDSSTVSTCTRASEHSRRRSLKKNAQSHNVGACLCGSRVACATLANTTLFPFRVQGTIAAGRMRGRCAKEQHTNAYRKSTVGVVRVNCVASAPSVSHPRGLPSNYVQNSDQYRRDRQALQNKPQLKLFAKTRSNQSEPPANETRTALLVAQYCRTFEHRVPLPGCVSLGHKYFLALIHPPML